MLWQAALGENGDNHGSQWETFSVCENKNHWTNDPHLLLKSYFPVAVCRHSPCFFLTACTLVRHNAQLEVSGQTVLGLVLSELDAAADSPAVSRASCALYRCLRLAGAPVWRIAQLLLHHMQDESPNQEASVEYLAETVRVLREPLTLIEWARVAVRTLLGSALLSRKHLVPIPTVLQEYLLMPDDVLMKSDVRAVFEDSDDKAS